MIENDGCRSQGSRGFRAADGND
eukprot:COSAG03_NODE_26525_length_258_cov_1.597484_1_plen_22_part_01